MKPKITAMAFRRLAAWAIDWTVIVMYGVILFVFASPIIKPLFLRSAFEADATGFIILTLPIFVYLSVSEAVWGGTLGKRLLKLRVCVAGTKLRASGTKVMFRNAIKLVPWELAHFSIWNAFIFSDSPFRAEGYVALVLAYGLAGLYIAGLFFKSGRTLYDSLSGLYVEQI